MEEKTERERWRTLSVICYASAIGREPTVSAGSWGGCCCTWLASGSCFVTLLAFVRFFGGMENNDEGSDEW